MDKTDSGKRLCYLQVSTVAFQFLIFLFWLARSFMTGERQTKIKNCKKTPVDTVNNTTAFAESFVNQK